MKTLPSLLLLLAVKMAAAQAVTIDTFQLFDANRDRTIPVKVYRPTVLTGQHPVIIFSHGLGGSRNAAPYLGQHLAAHGYVCFFIQHVGSDESVWRGKPLYEAGAALKESIRVPTNFINRLEDVPFLIRELSRLNEQDVVLHQHLDLQKIGMAGHSYGARSTMIAAGEKIGGTITKYAVPQIKAGLVLSPNTPERVRGELSDYYISIRIPLFHMTGTNDQDPLNRSGSFNPAQRQQPYRNISTSPQYLLVLDGATHATFGGLERPRLGKAETSHLDAVKAGALAFFDAYLKNDEAQLHWLQQQFASSLNEKDAFEFKQAE